MIVTLPVDVNVALDMVDASGVASYSLPSKYISKNLSVPIATYLLPSRSTNE